LREDGLKRLAPQVAAPYLLDDEDLLFARSGATSGKAFRYRTFMGPSCFAGYLIRFRLDPRLALPELVELWTHTSHYWRQITEATVQSTIQNVNADRYLTLGVPHVPPAAQPGLVDAMRCSRRRTAKLKQDIGAQTALLTEHRQALITAAVTGEVDVPPRSA
jgi:type I restriction enzyme S subunit